MTGKVQSPNHWTARAVPSGRFWIEWRQVGNIRDLTITGLDLAAKFQWNPILCTLLKACCVPSTVLKGGKLKDLGPAVAQLCWGQDTWTTQVSALRLTWSSVVPNFLGVPYSLGNIVRAICFLPRKKSMYTQDICLPVSLSPCWFVDPRTKISILHSREK